MGFAASNRNQKLAGSRQYPRMNWAVVVSIFALIVSWTLFLSGAFDFFGWEGFGKGLAIGSLTALAPIISFVSKKTSGI
jgi:hypothetical protein